MKRVIKAAVAVTSLGLAAALSVPAHAEVRDLGVNNAPSDDPLGGLLGGVGGVGGAGGGGDLLAKLTGGNLLGGLLGGVGKSGASGPADMRNADLQNADIENQAEPMARDSFEDATVDSGPLPELAPGGAGLPVAGDLLKQLPVLGSVVPGASRAAVPDTATGLQDAQSRPEILRGAFTSVADLMGGSLGGAMAELSRLHLAPEGASAPLVEAFPGTTQAASIDEIAPLVEDAGARPDVITSLGWATPAQAGDVDTSWAGR